MKVFVVKSSSSEVPLAEVRVEGDMMEFIVDNTQGKIPAKVGRSYAALVKFVGKSSHLSITSPQKATVNLLRYVMDNGDSVEITSDGHTVILNGKLLDQNEKDALFVAFRRGDIKVSRKTDIQQAIPVLPPSPPLPPPVKTKLSPAIMQKIAEEQDQKDRSAKMSDASYDDEIENMSLVGAEDKEWTKQMLYWLRYGGQNVRK